MSLAAKFECEVPYKEIKTELNNLKYRTLYKSEDKNITLKVRARDVDAARIKAIDKCSKLTTIRTVMVAESVGTKHFEGCDLPQNNKTKDNGEITCREIN